MKFEENTEIVNDHRGKFAEGSCDEKPTDHQILLHLLKRNYLAYNIDITFDHFQGFWRWYADITPIDEM